MKLDNISENVLSPTLFFPISARLKNSPSRRDCSQEILVSFAKIFINFIVY